MCLSREGIAVTYNYFFWTVCFGHVPWLYTNNKHMQL